jgi:hypothetical protein
VDLRGVQVYASPDTLHTHKEDYRIATLLAEKYGFMLNRPVRPREIDSFNVHDTWALSFYTKLGAHKEMYFKQERFRERKFLFTGNGGECIRDYWPETVEHYVNRAVERCHRYYAKATVDCPRMERSTRNVLNRTFDALRKHYASVNHPVPEEDMTQVLYRETRCRNHFGKAIIESWLSNTVSLSPLMDPDLLRLKRSTAGCQDKSLLVAMILSRYLPDLPDIPFDSGRKIMEDTLLFARQLNQRFPLPSHMERPAVSSPEKASDQPVTLTKDVPLCQADEELKNVFLSPAFEKWFEYLYEIRIYHIIRSDTATRRLYPLYLVYAAVAIVKILMDEKAENHPSVPFVDYLSALASDDFPLSRVPSRPLASRIRSRLLRQIRKFSK